jgi:hypothetical protein
VLGAVSFERFTCFSDCLSSGLHAIMQRFGDGILHRFDTPIQRFEVAFVIRLSRGKESAQPALLFAHWYNGMGS